MNDLNPWCKERENWEYVLLLVQQVMRVNLETRKIIDRIGLLEPVSWHPTIALERGCSLRTHSLDRNAGHSRSAPLYSLQQSEG